MNAAKSAIAAGYTPGTNTKHLEENPEIIARMAELHEEFQLHKEQQKQAAIEAARTVGQLTGVGRSWVIRELAEVAGLAKQQEQFKEAINALELIGKDFGMFTGGGSEDEGKNVPQNFDVDTLGHVLQGAMDAIPKELSDMEKARVFGEDTAMALIQGQVKGEDERKVAEEKPAEPERDPDDLDFDEEADRRILDAPEDDLPWLDSEDDPA